MNIPDQIVSPKHELTADELDAQRIALQAELAHLRQRIIQEWCPAAGGVGGANSSVANQAHFPRSATMRFLCGRKVATMLSQLVAWQFGRHYPTFAFWKNK